MSLQKWVPLVESDMPTELTFWCSAKIKTFHYKLCTSNVEITL